MTRRMLVVGVMLLFSSWAVPAVGHGVPIQLRRPFSQFPDSLETWRGESRRFDARTEEILGVTDYVSKVYQDSSNRFLHLFVGFYASQRQGESIHSPKNCLPGNGWFIIKREVAVVKAPPYSPFEVNSYIVENGIDRQVVLYWYQQSGGRIVTDEYIARLYLVLDGLTKRRSDAALIRVSVPFEEDAAAAVRTGLDFLQTAYPTLLGFLPHDAAVPAS